MTTPQQRIDRIKRTSLIFQFLMTAFLVLLPLSIILVWSFLDLDTMDIDITAQEIGPLTPFERIAAATLGLAAMSALLFAIFNLRRLFGLYAHGQFFEPANVRCLRNMGWALVLHMPLNILYGAALSVLLSLNQPAGERMLAVNISSDHIGVAIIGAVVIIISWIMAEAVDLSRDNAAII